MRHFLTAALFFVLFAWSTHTVQAQTCDISVSAPSIETLTVDLTFCNPINDSGNFSIVLAYPDGTTSAPIGIDVVSGSAQIPLFIGADPILGNYSVLLYYSGRYISAASYEVLEDGCELFLPSDAQVFVGTPVALSGVNCYPLPNATNTYIVQVLLPDVTAQTLTFPVVTGSTISFTTIPSIPGTYNAILNWNGVPILNTQFIAILPPTASPTAISCAADPTSIDTAIGCIPYGDATLFTGFFVRWFIAIGGGLAVFLILYAGMLIQTAVNNPKQLQSGRELMTAAVAGLIMIIFSVFILRVIGVDVLGILI